MMFDGSANASSTPLERHLRYMQMGDINDVVKIDQASFDPAWTSASYEFEINRSPCSYMIVLEERQPIHEPNMWQIVSARLRQSEPMQRMIVGYGGLWKIQEESHISTVASHPDKRGFGYGEILLAGMIRRALFLGAEYMVLEVRVSNHVAQKLYAKYGFEIVATKKNYYRSNNEDAYDMRLDFKDAERVQQLEALYQALQRRTPFVDAYSHVPHPRLGQ